VEGLLRTLQGFGIGRLAAILGGAAGVAAVLAGIFLHLGSPSMSLLYSNLDPKEASQVASALDPAGIKHEEKGDGTTIMVDRDKVAAARLMVAGKGLVTSGSVGYEIFDSAPALGQTDFVQNLNMKRATEGELARTIRSIQGVQSARVSLSLPKKQLFEQDAEAPSGSVMLQTGARRMSVDQVRAVRNLVAASVPGMKPERVSVVDQTGDLLAGLDDASASGASATGERNDVEERIKKQVKDLVEGVVGAGKARVTVHADLDTAHVTTQEEKFDPDDQVTRSTRETTNASKENKPGGSSSTVSAAQNVPNGQGQSATLDTASTTNGNDNVTNYEIGHTTTTTVKDAGEIKRLTVSVAVDGATGPAVKGKPGAYTPRTAAEMANLDALVKSAVGFDPARKDDVKVINVRFQQPEGAEGGAAAGGGLAFDKNDFMRFGELGVMLVVAALLIFFVARPMMKGVSGGGGASPGFPMLANGGGAAQFANASAAAGALPNAHVGAASALALAGPQGDDMGGIDIARIEGQVKMSSVKKVSEFVDKHPDESVSIIRSWLHEA
jgi:flagellar M-ring protein FliF